MASSSEVGHNKNVANFSTAVQVLTEMGTLYNSSNTRITIQKLELSRTTLTGLITELNTKIPAYRNAVVNRETATEPLSKLMTKIINNAKGSGIPAAEIENLYAQVKKIRGNSTKKATKLENTESETISTSQMSYDSRIANLGLFIEQLATHPQYNPNENELKITNLQEYRNQLIELSIQVNATGNALITARSNRNQALYFGENNIIQLIKEIKAYLKSVGDPAKPYLAAITKLKFTNK